MRMVGVLIIGIVVGFILGILWLGKILKKEILSINKKLVEQTLFRQLLLEWIRLKNNKESIAHYFHKNHYSNIAIYGMGDLGERFYEEIVQTDIHVDHIVDRNANNIIADVPTFTPDGDLPEVDVVVVTAIQFFDEIKKDMSEKYHCPIVSLEDVVYESR